MSPFPGEIPLPTFCLVVLFGVIRGLGVGGCGGGCGYENVLETLAAQAQSLRPSREDSCRVDAASAPPGGGEGPELPWIA